MDNKYPIGEDDFSTGCLPPELRDSELLWLCVGADFSLSVSATYRMVRKQLSHASLGVVLQQCPAFLPSLAPSPLITPAGSRQKKIYPHQIDSGTGLRNRETLMDTLVEWVQGGEAFYLVTVDIDHFNSLLSFYGKQAGDRILQHLAWVLHENLQSAEVFKLIGDRYILLVKGSLLTDAALQLLLERLAHQSMEWEGYRINLGLSFGLSVLDRPPAATDPLLLANALLSASGMALDKARQKREPVHISRDPNLRLEFGEQLRVGHLLVNALQQDKIDVFYQPVISNDGDRLICQECLARIRHNQGWIGADRFIGQVGQLRLQGDLTLKVLEKVCRVMQRHAGHFSINLLPEDLLDTSTLGAMAYLIERYGVGPRLTLELAETRQLLEWRRGEQGLALLRRLGCQLAIDDFGSGDANLVHLSRLKPDWLKLDGALVRDLDENPDLRRMVRGIVQIASDFGIGTIAKYVHSREVYYWVRKLGVTASQGFYLRTPGKTPWDQGCG